MSLKKTVDAFWKMVKHHDVGTIVMLNEFSEEAVVPYWPTKVKTEKVFGKIRIRLLETKTSKVQNKPGAAEIVYRKLLLSSSDKEHRVVNHFHYANWKDGKAPDEKGILDLIRCVNQYWHGCAHQTAVHCYAGVGRTGMYTLLDKCIKDIESGKAFDVREEVRYLRSPQTGRYPYMLTEPQYILSHRILEKVQRTFLEQETLRETLVRVAELFEENLEGEALQLTESLPVPHLHNIYEKLWRVMQKPRIPNYGKLAFHNLTTAEKGVPSEKKSLAIHLALSDIQESNTGNIHGPVPRRCSLI